MTRVIGYRQVMLPIAKSKPWLVIGKGPSIDLLHSLPIHKYNSIAINHAINAAPFCDFAHVTDFDVLHDIYDSLCHRSKAKLVTPFFMHFNNKPSKAHSIDAIASDTENDVGGLLDSMANAGNLCTYNSSLSYSGTDREKALGSAIRVKYFSAVAVVNLLASLDVKNISLIGIDGGNSYSNRFSNLKPLTNGRNSFDVQFSEIDRTAKLHSIKIERLGLK